MARTDKQTEWGDGGWAEEKRPKEKKNVGRHGNMHASATVSRGICNPRFEKFCFIALFKNIECCKALFSLISVIQMLLAFRTNVEIKVNKVGLGLAKLSHS